MEAKPRTVRSYIADNGTVPFDDWLTRLRDLKGKAQIDYRINKLRRGLLGDYDDVGNGVLELRLDNAGPGYRIYIMDDGHSSLLLCGGTKQTQTADIARAKYYRIEKQKNAKKI